MIPLLILLVGGKGRANRANGRRSICKSAEYVKKDGAIGTKTGLMINT
jgi:hypothetical protein